VLTGVLMVAALFAVLRGGHLTSGTFKNTESARVQQLVESVTGHSDDVTFVVLFKAERDDATQDDLAATMRETLAPVASDPAVAAVVTPEDAPGFEAAKMVNEAERTRVAFVTMRGSFPDALKAFPALRKKLVAPGYDTACIGRLPYMNDLNATLEHDLVRAELIALPLALLVLVLVFRTLLAAATPVGVGSMAVIGGLGLVLGLSHTMDVAMYTVNVCSLIGLGVSIDYCLFLVSRYREELARGLEKDEAIVRAVSTAGRTIAFSGVAVCTGLAGLLFFYGSYLFSMGIGGAIVVALAVLFALTFLPALLSLLGDRVFRHQLFKKKGEPKRFWERMARGVMKRPLLVGIPTLLVLLGMGVPFLGARLAAADVRVLDRKVEARRGYELLKTTHPELAKNRVAIAVEFPSSPALTPERVDALYDLSKRVAAMPNVSGVESLFLPDDSMSKEQVRDLVLDPPFYAVAMIEQGKAATVGDRVVTIYALTDKTPDTEEARDIVRALRADRGVGDGKLSVGGPIALDVDATSFIQGRAPYAFAFVVGATLVLLFLLLSSIVLPIKAVFMNFLSMTGSFGALVYIFQYGHFGVTEPRPLEPTLPVLLFCVLFGLSMDYEVLLLSRIRESYLRTHDNTRSVAEGLEKTANLITSAAAIMVAVFSAFAFAHVVMIQAVGIGMALAVALDATLVRTLLVPATMRLMGNVNWYCPRWLRIDALHHDAPDEGEDAPLPPSSSTLHPV